MMKFRCIIVFGFFVMLELVTSIELSKNNETSNVISSVGPSAVNETSKVVSSFAFSEGNESSKVILSVAPVEMNESSTNAAVSVEPSENENKTIFKHVFSVEGRTPSKGILEHLEKKLGLAGGEPNLEHVEEALSYAYKWLNLDLPVCQDHPAGSQACLLMQFEGLRNKSKELEVYDSLVSLQQFLYLFEATILYHLRILIPGKGLILDNPENHTDIHYLRCQRFFKEARNHTEIRKLRHIFHQNESIIEDHCRTVDRVFSYRYGEIERTGLYMLALPDVKKCLLRCGDKYAPEVKLTDAMIRLQVLDEELLGLFTTPLSAHRRMRLRN